MRNYPNFLDAYLELHKDQFVPDKFHFWTGVSILAGALERKVWLARRGNLIYYPNMYILLVSHPGIGKSSAITPGVDMLRDISHQKNSIRFIPSQVTDAKLIQLMAAPNTFHHSNKFYEHCSGYYFASEASACLKNVYGDMVSTMTAFYDCDKIWEKSTKSMGDKTETLTNVCFNILAGSTFDYLGKLVTDENLTGGFASRLTYIIQKEAMDRFSPWDNNTQVDESVVAARKKLTEDLAKVHEMIGPFAADDDFINRWEYWFPRADKERQAHPSEKMQFLKARKSTTLMKLCMILSAAESSDRILRARHWDRAMELTDAVERDLPDMLRESRARDNKSNAGAIAAIFRLLVKQSDKKMKRHDIEQVLSIQGFNTLEVERLLNIFITENKILKLIHSTDGTLVELVGNPDHYL